MIYFYIILGTYNFMIFNIVLVGPTNVGKSTLFNTLVLKNTAIVHNTINFTRDRKCGIFNFKNYQANIFDTAGFELNYNKTSILQKSILDQTFIAIQESHLILLVLNIEYGITEENKILVNFVRKQSKKIFLILNKIDTIKNDQYKPNEYYCLGIKDIFLISALKSFGIVNVKQHIYDWCSENVKIQSHLMHKKIETTKNNIIENIKITILGKENVGKSTLFNTLLNRNRSIVYDSPGTTRDSITDTVIINQIKYIFSDTAGIRTKNNDSKQSLSILKTLQSITDANICMLVLDYYDGFTKKDIWILNTIMNSGKKILILINKSEDLSLFKKKQIKKYLFFQYKFINLCDVHFISALYGRGIKKIFCLINKLNKQSNYTMKSSELTKIMYQAVQKYPPKIIQGKQIKLQYAHPGGYHPPTIIIHGNRLSYVSKNYKRYLESFFQNHLNFIGYKIKIIFKNKHNPYIVKK